MSHIAIIGTGGTIQNTDQGRIGVDDLLDRIGAEFGVNVAAIATTHVIDLFREGGEALTPHHWAQVADAARRWAADEAISGIVVTHGTFTIEETCFFLHLTVGTRKPIVFTCSQRKHGSIGNDGDRNLVDALRVASDPQSAGKGAVLVVDEQIHAAREVTKTSRRAGGFGSHSLGILGSVESDQVTWYRTPTRRHTFASEFSAIDLAQPLPRVDIIAAYPGADGAAVRALVEAGAVGIVVNGLSFIGAPFVLQEPDLLEAIDQGVVVVLSSRGGEGRIPHDAPVDSRYVTGDSLTPQKARVLLMTALAASTPPADMDRIFDQY